MDDTLLDISKNTFLATVLINSITITGNKSFLGISTISKKHQLAYTP